VDRDYEHPELQAMEEKIRIAQEQVNQAIESIKILSHQ
jgi:hypothetical protein